MNNGKGIYFNREKATVRRVDDVVVSLGVGWIRISDDPRMGLLEARRLIEAGGLAADAAPVYWDDLSEVGWQQRQRVSQLIRDFRQDSARQREAAPSRPGLIHRLVTGIGGVLRPGAP